MYASAQIHDQLTVLLPKSMQFDHKLLELNEFLTVAYVVKEGAAVDAAGVSICLVLPSVHETTVVHLQHLPLEGVGIISGLISELVLVGKLRFVVGRINNVVVRVAVDCWWIHQNTLPVLEDALIAFGQYFPMRHILDALHVL